MTTASDTRVPPQSEPTPGPRVGRRPRLGWFHALVHRALLAGHHMPDEPPAVQDSVHPAIRELALLVEHRRSEFAHAARLLGAEYKGGYWMMYVFAPAAVLCSAAAAAVAAATTTAATAAAHVTSQRLLTIGELVLIVLILLIFYLVRRGGWQEKWIQARRTAEHLRYLPLVAPFVTRRGGNWYEQMAARRGMRIIVDPEVTRMCASLDRADATRALRLDDPQFYIGYLQYVRDLLGQQIHYHTQKASIEQALGRRVGFASTAFFAVTLACTFLLVLVTGRRQLSELGQLTRLLATVLPALGAAMRGVLAQGESHRVAALSEGMAVRLAQLREQLKSIPGASTATGDLENLVWNAVQELLSEADTWMRLQESAPLSLGG